MPIQPPSTLRNVTGLTEDQLVRARDFLHGAVYCWVKNRSGEQFALRDLMGGENFEWLGTPLYPLFEKHSSRGKDDDTAIAEAAKDAGWLLKTVLSEDRRTFTQGDAGMANGFRWVGGEP
jgi:hypothetical protein